jgi:hypothetical protein
MELMVRGPGNIPILPITWDDLKAIQDVLKGHLASVRATMPAGAKREKHIQTLRGLHERVTGLLAQGEGMLLFSVDELMALKEAISSFGALIMWMVPPSNDRDGVITSLQALYQQFSQMLSPFVN